MNARIAYAQVNPKVSQLLLAIERHLHGSTLGSRLLHLVQTRASQINGCAFCLELAVSNINTWNRLNVAFRTPAGNYRPGMYKSSIGGAVTAA